MNHENNFQDDDSIVPYEIKILAAKNDLLKQKIAQEEESEQFKKEIFEKVYKKLSEILGFRVDETNWLDEQIPEEIRCETFDEVIGKQDNLIRSIHYYLPYSLLQQDPELNEHIPSVRNGKLCPLDLLTSKASSRALEIITEETSENTHRAHIGDLIYFQAWLSAIGFSFKEPISEKEILTYIVQHAEGLDPEIDKKLVAQGYKAKFGPHKLATIKRRLGSLSVFLELRKLPNPCRTKEIQMLLSKLSKKYGGSAPSGKAITREILDDMLNTCKDSLLDARDKAVLLFAWASGGRRRSEVVSAELKNLTTTPEGEFIYNMPHSKTDQEGKGNVVPVKGRAAKALKEWLTISNVTEGTIFRAVKKGGKIGNALSDLDVGRIVKRRLKMAMYDETQFSAHSLRSGFVTEAGRRQKPIGDVMQMTTHRSINTVMKYYQAGDISNNSAANLAD